MAKFRQFKKRKEKALGAYLPGCNCLRSSCDEETLRLQIDRSIICLLCGTSFYLDCCNEGVTNWRQKDSGRIIISVVDSSSSSLDPLVNCFTTVQCHAINRQSCLARVFWLPGITFERVRSEALTFGPSLHSDQVYSFSSRKYHVKNNISGQHPLS